VGETFWEPERLTVFLKVFFSVEFFNYYGDWSILYLKHITGMLNQMILCSRLHGSVNCAWYNCFLHNWRQVRAKVKWSRYRPGVAQRVGRGIAELFHERGTRRGWVVSSTPQPHFTPGKDPVPIVQEAGWALWAGLDGRKISNWRQVLR